MLRYRLLYARLMHTVGMLVHDSANWAVTQKNTQAIQRSE